MFSVEIHCNSLAQFVCPSLHHVKFSYKHPKTLLISCQGYSLETTVSRLIRCVCSPVQHLHSACLLVSSIMDSIIEKRARVPSEGAVCPNATTSCFNIMFVMVVANTRLNSITSHIFHGFWPTFVSEELRSLCFLKAIKSNDGL